MKSNLSVIQSNSDSSKHGHGAAKPKNPFEADADELSYLSDAGDAELLRTEVIELREPDNRETTLPDGSGLSVRHPYLSIKRHFNESDDEHTSETSSNNWKQKQRKVDDFKETIIMKTSPDYEETFNSSSDSESFCESCDRGSFYETGQMVQPQAESGHQNAPAIKADYELAGMIGEIIELLEEGKMLR